MRKLSLEKSCSAQVIILDKDVSKSIQVLNLKISYSMYTNLLKGTDDAEMNAQLEQNTSYCKINMFLENIINNALLVDIGDIVELDDTVNMFENPLVVLPFLNESTLLACLHSKLNTIAGENTHIDVLRFEDTVEGVTYSYDMSESEEFEYPELPVDQKEWLGDLPYWDSAWWLRNDISTYDRGAESEEELAQWEQTRVDQEVDVLNSETFNDIEAKMKLAFGKDDSEDANKKGEIVEIDFSKKKAKNIDKED